MFLIIKKKIKNIITMDADGNIYPYTYKNLRNMKVII